MPSSVPVGATAFTSADNASVSAIPQQRGDAGVPGTATINPRFLHAFWALPALLTAGLGLWRLTGPALWADELATWGAVRISWHQLWQLSGVVDAVLTPYYAAMKIYTSVAGTSTAALRLPSVVAMVGTTIVVTALGRRLGGRRAGLVAGLLFAVIPASARYAQEARPYAIAMFAAALAVLFLIRLLEDPGAGRAAAYSGALILLALSQPLSALLVLGGHALAVVLRQVRAGRPAWFGSLTWLAAVIPGGVAALILVGLGYRSKGQISWITHLALSSFAVIPDRIFLSGAVGGIVLGLAIFAVRRNPEHLYLSCAGFAPLLLLLAADQVTPIWVARYVLVVVPPLAALAAATMLRLGKVQTVVALVLVAALGYPAQVSNRKPAGHSEDSTKIAAVIGALQKPGDVVVFPDTHPSIPWAPRDIYQRYLPTPRPPDVLAAEPQRADGHFLATECPGASCLGTPARIWIVRVDNPADPFKGMTAAKQKVLRDHYRPVRRWAYPLLDIILIERKPVAK